MAELVLTVWGAIVGIIGFVLLGVVFAILIEFCQACGEIEKKDWLE